MKKNKIGFKVKNFRKNKNITQVQLSKGTGISQGTISKMESCGNVESVSSVVSLALALGVPVKDLLK